MNQEEIDDITHELVKSGLELRPAKRMAHRILSRTKKARAWKALKDRGAINNATRDEHGDALAEVIRRDMNSDFPGVIVTFRPAQERVMKIEHISLPGGQFFI